MLMGPAYLAAPGAGQDGVGLSPVSVVSHCVQATSPITVSVRSVEPSYTLRGEEACPFRKASAGLGAWPTDPAET
jgi:hypothetical protein